MKSLVVTRRDVDDASRSLFREGGVSDEKIAQVAIDFIAFCFERRAAPWPLLYDEMCYVAGNRLYRAGSQCPQHRR